METKGAEKLGYKFRDKITGFTGIATGFVQYISGCNQLLIAPECGADGALRDSNWFDEQRMVQVYQERVALDNSHTPGFDTMAPKR